jgi:hypothetical protein
VNGSWTSTASFTYQVPTVDQQNCPTGPHTVTPPPTKPHTVTPPATNPHTVIPQAVHSGLTSVPAGDNRAMLNVGMGLVGAGSLLLLGSIGFWRRAAITRE